MLKKATMGVPLAYKVLAALPHAPPAQEGRYHFHVAPGANFDTVLDDVGRRVSAGCTYLSYVTIGTSY